MTTNVNDMQNAQAHFLTENLADERKEITEKHTSTAEDPAKDSIAPQMDVNQNRLEVARDSIDAGPAILGIAEFTAADYKKGADIEKIEVTGSEKTGKASIVLSLKDGRKYHSEDFGNSIAESQKIDLIKFQDPIEGQNVDSIMRRSLYALAAVWT